MSHVPRHATTYSIDVPDEEVAGEIARTLAERGHTVVCLAPKEPGHGGDSRWRVTSLDEGPYPSDDESWWSAAEERVVSSLSERVGGRPWCSQALPGTARRFLLHGEAVTDRTVEQVRDLRVAVLSREPARVPAPAIVHRLKNPNPSGGPTGEPVVLEGLDDIDWTSLSHAYGTAEDVPDILRRLAANDEGWDAANHDYFSAVVHQGTCYEVTPHTIRFLVQLARAPHLLPEYRLELLIHLAYIATLDPAPAAGEPIDDSSSSEAVTCQAIIDRLPDVLALWADAPATERAWLIVLAALASAAASDLLPGFQEFRRRIEGPSPALDLALALVSADDDAVLDLTLSAATWDEEIPPLLEPAAPLRARHLNVLVHLAMAELTPG